MDITCENFAETFPLFQASVQSADFIAFDTEFSGIPCSPNLFSCIGLTVGYDDKHHEYDTIEDRYQKLKHNCSRMNTF